MRSLLTFLLIYSVVSHAILFDHAYAADEEQVTFYPTYGYKEGDNWVIPMRIWVRERRAFVEKLIIKVARSLGDIDSKEIANFRSRIQDFVVDSQSREAVSFKFDNDPENQEYSSPRDFPQTDLNGLVKKAVIRIPIAKAKELLSRQGSQNGWLTYRATSKDHSGVGRVQLIEPNGISVISDIDDTIKITEIPAGLKVVVRNTFFRDFVAAPQMAKMYQGFSGASFHYVSGGPWQLYRPLSEFLFSEQEGFPEGTFHMKQVSKNLLSASTLGRP